MNEPHSILQMRFAWNSLLHGPWYYTTTPPISTFPIQDFHAITGLVNR